MPFQNAVNIAPAWGVAGDFASDNPRQSMLAGDSELVAGAAGVTVGKFAWANDNGVVTNAKPNGVARLGFVGREGQGAALITVWLAEASMLIPAGLGVVLHTKADFLVVNTVASAVTGNKVFASYADGSAIPGVSGTPPTVAITGNITNTSNQLANVSQAVYAGQPVSGAGIPAGTTITTGAAAGGTATMSANATATTAALAITTGSGVETQWFYTQPAAVGALATISQGG